MWIVNFHHALRGCEWPEAKLSIQRMCVASRKQHTAEALKVPLLHDLFHETPPQPFPSMLREDVNVREIGEGSFVSYDPSKTNLLTVTENPKT